MFISEALAQTGGAAASPGSGLEFFIPIILIMVVFYFLMIRPQQQRAKQKQQSLASVRRGDRVVTNSGVIGTVTKVVDDNELLVEVAEGMRLRVDRWLLERVISKGAPVSEGEGGGPKPRPEATGGQGQGAEGGGSVLKKLLGGKNQ